MGLLVFYFVLSILFSFLCSILEAVLLSVTPAYVNSQQRAGTITGKLLGEYKKDIDRPLSAILTLNTIAHTVGAIGVGAQAGKIYGGAGSYFSVGGIHLSYESIIAGGMTLAILILSEIIPKTLGANNWRSLTPFTVKTLQILMWILAPLVWLSQLITKSLKSEKNKSVLSRSDFTAMAMVGEESGTLDTKEVKIIKNLLDLEKLHVKDIMTPQTVALIANQEATIIDFFEKNKPIRYSRIPIYDQNVNNITGIVLKADILRSIIDQKESQPLKALTKPVKFIDGDKTLSDLFNFFTTERIHLAIVTDQFGSLMGLVSLEDMFETLLGHEITDEFDLVEDLQLLARKKWEERRQAKLKES